MDDRFRSQLAQSLSHTSQWRWRKHPVCRRAIVMIGVQQQPFWGMPAMDGDDRVVSQDLHGAGAATDFDRAADVGERHAVLTALEADQRIESDMPGVHDVERLRQDLWQWRQ